jgi:hypothetical protein
VSRRENSRAQNQENGSERQTKREYEIEEEDMKSRRKLFGYGPWAMGHGPCALRLGGLVVWGSKDL